MFKNWRKPSWWDKPITWGASVKFSLLSIPISLIIVLIEGLMFGWFDDVIDSAKQVVIIPYEKVKTSCWNSDVAAEWNKIFHKEEKES